MKAIRFNALAANNARAGERLWMAEHKLEVWLESPVNRWKVFSAERPLDQLCGSSTRSIARSDAQVTNPDIARTAEALMGSWRISLADLKPVVHDPQPLWDFLTGYRYIDPAGNLTARSIYLRDSAAIRSTYLYKICGESVAMKYKEVLDNCRAWIPSVELSQSVWQQSREEFEQPAVASYLASKTPQITKLIYTDDQADFVAKYAGIFDYYKSIDLQNPSLATVWQARSLSPLNLAEYGESDLGVINCFGNIKMADLFDAPLVGMIQSLAKGDSTAEETFRYVASSSLLYERFIQLLRAAELWI